MASPATDPADRELVVRRLVAAGCVAADEEADELLDLRPDRRTLDAWIARREAGEPLAWITGAQSFCDLTVRVDSGVYVPRVQSEELARRAARLLDATPGYAADLCTGAGAIAAYLARAVRGASVVGVDLDERSVRCARRNGVAAFVGDLAESLRTCSFDLVTAVAPYVPSDQLRLLPRDVQRYEPRRALDGGGDGLDVVRRIVESAARILRRNGWLVLELGADQDERLAPWLGGFGFDSITTWHDADGELRGLVASLSSPSGAPERRHG